MRQVPTKYAIIGGGKVARHTAHYLNQLTLPFWQWPNGRILTETFFSRLFETQTTHILALIADAGLAELIAQLRKKTSLPIVHFSGATMIEGSHSAHPLYTFGTELYDFETYLRIPFITCAPLGDILPGFLNPAYSIDPKKRALYHALAVMAGNFPMAIWAKVFEISEKELGLTRAAFFPYLLKSLENAMADPIRNLTGPRKRGDLETIEKHLRALDGDFSAQALYRATDDLMKELV